MIGTRPPYWPYYLNPETTQAYGVVAAYLGANGGNTLYDLGPTKSYHGTLTNGPTWTTGKFGEPAISLDGTSQYVDCGTGSVINITGTAITLAAWVCPSATVSQYARIIAKEAAYPALQYNICLEPLTNKIVFELYLNSSLTAVQASNAAAAVNVWTHLACTYDGADRKWFINGVLDKTVATTGSITSTTSNLLLSAYSGDLTTYCFPGKLAQPSVHSHALTAAQISELYRNPFLLYWQPSPVRTFWMGAAPAAPGGLSIPIAAYHYNHSLRA